MLSYLALNLPQGGEWLIILAVALLIFGRRLPEVGRSIGRGIVEFKKGIKGVKDELDDVENEVDQASEPKQLDADETPQTSSSEKQKVDARS